MLSKLTYKQRFYLILVGLLALCWLAIALAIRPTFKLKDELVRLRKELVGTHDLQKRILENTRRVEHIDRLIGGVNGDVLSVGLIEKASKYCKAHQLIFKEMPRRHDYHTVNFELNTYRLIIQGPFKNLLRLSNELEHSPKLGSLRALSFESKYNYREEKNELSATYYIQSIRDQGSQRQIE